MEILSPNEIIEIATERTVEMGLNVETNTGPFLLNAHPLKLVQNPLTMPPCATIHRTKFAYIR